MPKVYYRNTPTERRCRECGGSGDITVRRKAGDPESEVTGECPSCIQGWIRWAPHDPLTLLKELRRIRLQTPGFSGLYLGMRRRAMAPVTLPKPAAPKPVLHPAFAQVDTMFDQMFRPRLAA